MELQSGDIILYSNRFRLLKPVTWLSTLIRIFTRVPYDHCAIVVHSWGVPMLNEALGDGVICRPAAEHLQRKGTSFVVLRPLQPVSEQDLCRKANSMLGRKYDLLTLLVYQPLYRITGRWVGSTQDKIACRQFVCTEYVAWAHNLDRWWLYSAKELIEHPEFITVE